MENICRYDLDFALLDLEDFFLLFDFSFEIFFGWEVGEVFCSEELGILVENRVLGYVFAGFCAEDESDGGVVAFGAFEVIVHSDVHVHLAYVLMGDFGGLEVYEQEGFEEIVVENKIYVEVSGISGDVLLSGYECVAFSEFEKEFLDMGEDGTFKFGFGEFNVAWQSEEFRDERVL